MNASRKLAAVVLLVSAGSVWAQAFNIDFGLPGAGPSQFYDAAGFPGVWNSVEGEHTPWQNPEIIYDLAGLDGQPTDVILYQFGGTELRIDDDPTVGGDDAVLLNDCLVTHTANLESCLFIQNLEPGLYEVITYAWMPNHPETDSVVRLDFSPDLITVGGAWTGVHEDGVSYSRHIVEVFTGFMGIHSGNAVGGDLEIGAALNGVQIRPVESQQFGDHDGDTDVDLSDIEQYLDCVTGPQGGLPIGCTVFDIDGDADVDFTDWQAIQIFFTGPN